MKLKDFSNEDLMHELEIRSINKPGTGIDLVVGTICQYPEGHSVEVFSRIKKPSDLPSQTVYLRARMNGHRNYRLFYFKTDCFDELNKRLDEDPEGFSEWVINSDSIKFEDI